MDQTYELSLSVRDTTGGITTVFCTIQVTNASFTLSDTFQHLNQYLTIPEVSRCIYDLLERYEHSTVLMFNDGQNLPKETVVDYLIAWKNPLNNRGIRMELKVRSLMVAYCVHYMNFHVHLLRVE